MKMKAVGFLWWLIPFALSVLFAVLLAQAISVKTFEVYLRGLTNIFIDEKNYSESDRKKISIVEPQGDDIIKIVDSVEHFRPRLIIVPLQIERPESDSLLRRGNVVCLQLGYEFSYYDINGVTYGFEESDEVNEEIIQMLGISRRWYNPPRSTIRYAGDLNEFKPSATDPKLEGRIVVIGFPSEDEAQYKVITPVGPMSVPILIANEIVSIQTFGLEIETWMLDAVFVFVFFALSGPFIVSFRNQSLLRRGLIFAAQELLLLFVWAGLFIRFNIWIQPVCALASPVFYCVLASNKILKFLARISKS